MSDDFNIWNERAKNVSPMSWTPIYGEGDDRFEGWIDLPGWPTREEMKRKTPAEVDEVLKALEAEVAEYDAKRSEIAETEAKIEDLKRRIAERDEGDERCSQ